MSTADTHLAAEIESARRNISSDSYPMSIGELTNLYREDELIIRPAFQRLFRWDQEQKSRLVESILLGIPLPSIFVAQAADGKWELIDGLQRVSTILQLQGLLPASEHPPLVLEGTKYLPHLEGMTWRGESGKSLSDAQKLDFKRSKIDVKIIKRESRGETKYDLFQRLNSYGSPLTSQEMRTALLVGVSPEFSRWLESCAENPEYLNAIGLPDKLLGEKYAEELVLRFLFLHNLTETTQNKLRGFNQRLDDSAVELAESFPLHKQQLGSVFNHTFSIINSFADNQAFRKYDAVRNRFSGGFLNTAFEVIGMGLGFHIANGTPHRTDVLEAAKELWEREEVNTRFATGVSTEKRLSLTLPMGRDLMGR